MKGNSEGPTPFLIEEEVRAFHHVVNVWQLLQEDFSPQSYPKKS